MDKQITFKNAVLEGVFQVPYSKSVSNRMLIINALSGGKGSLENLSECDDTRALRRALADGSALVDVGGAGTAMRFLAAYFALVPGEHVLTGSPRMARRPIKVLVDALRELGADIAYLGEEGYPPLRVTGGGLRGKNLVVDASVSSQYLSALMMIGPCVPGGLRLQLQGTPVSAPYLQMTAGLMRRCGARVRVTRRAVLVQDGGYSRVPGVCEYDWSAVSFFYELLAVAGRGWMRFLGFRSASVQGDRAQVELWKRLLAGGAVPGVRAGDASHQGVRPRGGSCPRVGEIGLPAPAGGRGRACVGRRAGAARLARHRLPRRPPRGDGVCRRRPCLPRPRHPRRRSGGQVFPRLLGGNRPPPSLSRTFAVSSPGFGLVS